MFVVLTNDDGIFAPGLRVLYRELLRAGHRVRVVAPLEERSASGHAITVQQPLRIRRVEEENFSGIAVSGTPVDCVKLGLSRLVDQKPDLLVSGMNAGSNVGPDILYSGTLSAASEGAFMGCSALAVSHNSRKASMSELEDYARFAVEMIPRIPWAGLPPYRVISFNLPDCPLSECRGVRCCPQSGAKWNDSYDERLDPWGRPYWWMEGVVPQDQVLPGTDKYELEQGWAVLTTVQFELTDEPALALLREHLGSGS
ncbi:MAG: 5'/3'-nucleotidase SurE [Desulfovibrionaceae bacterium]|nr:5'/3'-nucleotidase SurE [Desulfovibrionaceae bacterium]